MDKKVGKSTKQVALSICMAILVLLLASVLFPTQVMALHAGKISDDRAYAFAMSGIDGIAEANPKVVELSMLASHDANTFNLTGCEDISGEVHGSAKTLYRWAGGMAYRYTRTQMSCIYDQLMQGVRYLHFKASYYGGVWCGSHSLIDGPIEPYIQDVLKFLQSAPGEIVVVQFQLMYGKGTNTAAFLDELFNIQYHGRTLKDFVPYRGIPLSELTYNDVTDGGKQGGAVVMLLSDKQTRNKLFFNVRKSDYFDRCYGYAATYSKPELTSKWHNRMNRAALSESISKECARIMDDYDRLSGGFRVMQMQTSPTGKDLLETVGAWSLVSKAKTHNAAMLDDPSFDEWMKAMPVVECDFTTTAGGDFNKRINQKISAYNRTLVQTILSGGTK